MNIKLQKSLVISLLAFFYSIAHAETYSYVGDNFTSADGSYTVFMRVTGILTTSQAIPSSQTDFDIRPIITSWTFTDGLQTIDSNNGGQLHPSIRPPLFSTDADGNITASNFTAIMSPLSTATGPGNRDSFIILFRDGVVEGDGVGRNLECERLSGGFCSDWVVGNGEDFATVSVAGSWTRMQTPQLVPSISIWGLGILAGLLGVTGIRRMKNLKELT